MPSPAVQDYLKAIYKLSRYDQVASTSSIAEMLGVAAASVTGMLKRLDEQGLIQHEPYQGARLTDEGEREAIRMIRRHRVLELFLVEVLGYTWDQVHDEAEKLEHAASDQLIDRMAQVLGEPTADPHGDPIPGVDSSVFVEQEYPSLAQMAVGDRGILRRVSDEDPETLRYLADLQLRPGAELELIERFPVNGPLRVRVAGEERIVGRELSESLQVEQMPK